MESSDPLNILTYKKISPDIDLIEGSISATRKKDLLKSYKIHKIITVCGFPAPPFPDDFEYKMLYADDEDTYQLKLSFDDCADFINEAMTNNQGVFVHCSAGISRSTTIIIAYLIKYKIIKILVICVYLYRRMGRDEALKHVKSFRPVASPNSGFLQQLREYEYEVLGEPKNQ